MTHTQALLAVAHLAQVEWETVLQDWNRTPDAQTEDAAHFAAVASQAHEDAKREGATEADWTAMLDWLSGPVLE